MDKKINRDYVETPRAADLVYAGASTIAELVPGVNKLFNFLFTEPAMQRRDDWIESLQKRINELEFSIEDIKCRIYENENTISAVLYASPLAIKTKDNEKLEAFRNIIVNTILYPNFEEYKIQMFMNFIDGFTELHIILLKFLGNPRTVIRQKDYNIPSSQQNINLEKEFSQKYLKFDKDLVNVALNSLKINNLIKITPEEFTTNMILSNAFEPHTTSLGNELLKFISLEK